MLANASILLIGGGNMGRALLTAWRAENLVGDVTVVDPHPIPELQAMAQVVADTKLATGSFDAVILATKPQIAAEVMPVAANFVTKNNFFLSIAAGKQTAFFQQYLGADKAIIRAMPNTPCQINQGITALYATPATSPAVRETAHRLFAPTGFVFTVKDEDKMHDITAITASGPGFVFYAMELLEKTLSRAEAIETIAACNHPFYHDYTTAAQTHAIADQGATQQIITQLFKGSVSLAQAFPDKSFADLRRAVTSPNGTTESGLKVLMEATEPGQMAERIAATLDAATRRSIELAK